MPGRVSISKPPSPPPIAPPTPKLKPMSETTVTPQSPPSVPKVHEIVRADPALSVSHLPEEVRPATPPVPRLSERVQPFSPTSVPQTLSELLLPGPAIRPPGSMLPPLWSASDLRTLVEEGYEPSVVGWALDHAHGNRMDALEWLEENAVFQVSVNKRLAKESTSNGNTARIYLRQSLRFSRP